MKGTLENIHKQEEEEVADVSARERDDITDILK
jgi:hypothetical protein